MIINEVNSYVGYKAMASVLLLYYHLLEDGGILNNQTIYIDQNDFNGFDFLGVEIQEPERMTLDLNENLIREGAIIYLLCDLDDWIGEYEQDFHLQPQVKKIVEALRDYQSSPIPEVALLFEHISRTAAECNFSEYNKNIAQYLQEICV